MHNYLAVASRSIRGFTDTNPPPEGPFKMVVGEIGFLVIIVIVTIQAVFPSDLRPADDRRTPRSSRRTAGGHSSQRSAAQWGRDTRARCEGILGVAAPRSRRD